MSQTIWCVLTGVNSPIDCKCSRRETPDRHCQGGQERCGLQPVRRAQCSTRRFRFSPLLGGCSLIRGLPADARIRKASRYVNSWRHGGAHVTATNSSDPETARFLAATADSDPDRPLRGFEAPKGLPFDPDDKVILESPHMRTIFTTGQVAKICKVAPRTVSKWFDSGRLRGYRIPGSQDRRIPREHLAKTRRRAPGKTVAPRFSTPPPSPAPRGPPPPMNSRPNSPPAGSRPVSRPSRSIPIVS